MSSPTLDDGFPPGTSRLYNGDGEVLTRATLTLVPRPSRDPNQPLNWSKGRKAINFAFTLALTITIFTALSIQIIFWQFLARDFRTDYATLIQTLCTLGTGLAIGCFVFVPFALKFGRRPVYLVSTGLVFAMMIWSSRMTTVAELFITNFFTGLGGAVNESIVGMTIADLFFVHQRGTMNALYLTSVMIGSFLTPLAAGVQATNMGWRWVYYLLSLFTGLLFVLFLCLYEETKYVPVLEGVSTSSTDGSVERISTQDPNSKTAAVVTNTLKPVLSTDPFAGQEVAADQSYEQRTDARIPLRTWSQRLSFLTPTPEPFLKIAVRPLRVLTFPHVFFAGIQYAAGLTWLTILATMLSTVMSQPPYNFNPAQIGYMGVGPFIGNLVGSIYSGPLNDKAIRWFAKRNNGIFEPEMRLKLLHIPSVVMAGGIIMFGVTISQGMHWIYPTVGGALFAFGLGAFGDVVLTIVIDSYRDIVGEAFTGIAFMRNVFSIWVPFTITPWMMSMGIRNMFITMGMLSLAISLLYLPMMWFGKRARTKLAGRYAEMSQLRR